MAQAKTNAERTWHGDHSRVTEVRYEYQKDPEKHLLAYAVELYSARADKVHARSLLKLHPELMARGRYVVHYLQHSGMSTVERINHIDVLTTCLAWMSRQQELDAELREETSLLAIQLCRQAMIIMGWNKQALVGHHTPYLITLTRVQLLVERQSPLEARGLLDELPRVQEIKDHNQRARVHRKLGMVYRSCGRVLVGYAHSIQAFLVPGIPLDVQKKNLAGFLGIDR